MPPYDWITEKIAPEFGYIIGDDKAPLIEYYAYFDPLRNKHEFCDYMCPSRKSRFVHSETGS